MDIVEIIPMMERTQAVAVTVALAIIPTTIIMCTAFIMTNRNVKPKVFFHVMFLLTTIGLIFCSFVSAKSTVDVPTGISEYHVKLSEMTPEQLSDRYGDIRHTDDYWVFVADDTLVANDK